MRIGSSLLPALPLLALPLLAGCGGASSTSPPPAGSAAPASAAASSAAPSGAGGGAAGGGKASCAQAPAATVGGALGDTFADPQQTLNGDTVAMCQYLGKKLRVVIIRIQTDQTAAGFTAEKQGYPAQGLKTTDVPGFMDAAYSSVHKTTYTDNATLVALKGSTEILVTGDTTLDRERQLLTTLFGSR
ncbi:MAG TPA: hypothetical protein VI248_04595 [Kineosporiaceae bacterium]